MYSLPDSFDSSSLAGKQVECVCFLEYQVNIYFTGKAFLQIEGRFELVDTSGAEVVTGFPVLSSRLPSLIGDSVTDLDFDRASGSIRIVFSKGPVLSIDGNSSPYESYRLSLGDETILI
jgi:hypothetical protein